METTKLDLSTVLSITDDFDETKTYKNLSLLHAYPLISFLSLTTKLKTSSTISELITKN